MSQPKVRANVGLGGAGDGPLKRSRSGRVPRFSRGGVGARATLDLGTLAQSLNSNSSAAPGQSMAGISPADALAAADRPDAHRHGMGSDTGLEPAVELGLAPGSESARARVGGSGFGTWLKSIFSRKAAASRSWNASTSTTGLDGTTSPAAARRAAAAAGRGGPSTSMAGMKRRSSRISGLLSGRTEERATAASSLGSLQSYAQTTVKDSGPFQGCFNNSTSEVALVKRFTRQVNDQAKGQNQSQSLGNVRGITETAVESALVFSEEVRKNGLLSRRPERFDYPNFALGEYGAPNTWNSDVFVLIHNSIRWEIMDLYTIIGSLQRRWLALTMLDMYELCEYWETFELFLGQWFEVEDQIIFPYLLSVAASSQELARYYKVVKYNKEMLVGMLYDVGATIEMFNSAPAGEVFPALYRQIVDYLPKILDYMEQQDAVLPSVFAAHCHPEDRIMLNRAVANFLIRAANGRDSIAILTRWIEDSMVLQIWKDENLSSRAKSSHKKWLMKLDENHVEIARKFQRRLRSGKPSNHLKDEVQGSDMPDRPRDRPTSPHFSPLTL